MRLFVASLAHSAFPILIQKANVMKTVLTACLLALVLPAIPAPKARAGPDNPTIRVGSKAFTEGVILGEMLAALARSAGAETQHLAELGGTQVLWKALLSGDIDAYVEYTGTLSQEIFAGKAKNEVALRKLLRAQGIGMSGQLGFNNTYALGMREELADRLHVRAISGLVEHPNLRLGVSEEFLHRKDGWPGLKQFYGLPQTHVRGMDHGLAYRGLANGSHDIVDLYSTDPEIVYYKLRVLQDDRNYFPRYNAVILFRLDLEERAPAVLDSLLRLEGQISNEAMSEMNSQVMVKGAREKQAAVAFISDRLGAPPVSPETGHWFVDLAALGQHTREHLFLVAVSLTAAVLIAVPLGVLSWRFPSLGRVILGSVGVIQTLPSLALLVFMIPFLGLGAWPAIVALFLYSLLPIVRNTATGLQDIPLSIHESAQVLGLPEWTRLWRIELPMASRSILAGIKTAAVINVGTATLGALIGAGGYGQPIQTGIRLNSISLILQGAIPAAVLALLVQGLFAWAEKWLVPRGLRLTGT